MDTYLNVMNTIRFYYVAFYYGSWKPAAVGGA